MDAGYAEAQRDFMREAISLARQAEHQGNLPIGAVLVLDGEIVARGMNAIRKPLVDLTRHAEIEALRSAPPEIMSRSREMTLFTTLEPCLMCAGAILLHRIGRLVYGARDPYGGVGRSLPFLPPFFEGEFSQTRWEGPALLSECEPLFKRIQELEGFSIPDSTPPPEEP